MLREFCSIVFFYSSTFYQLPFFAETRRNKIDKKVPALYIISSLKWGICKGEKSIMNLISQYKGLRKENYVLCFGRFVTAMGAMVRPMLTMICSQSLNDIFCSSAFSFNCNHTLFLHSFQ